MRTFWCHIFFNKNKKTNQLLFFLSEPLSQAGKPWNPDPNPKRCPNQPWSVWASGPHAAAKSATLRVLNFYLGTYLGSLGGR